MNHEEARDVLIEAFLDVAPDADPTTVSPDANYREALSIDSMDFLAILERVADETGTEVPEADYPKIETFDGFVAYLSSS
jgi:acyl carrier protein